MRDLHCLCLILSFLWEQMVKAYKYMSGIFLVSHSSNQQATDGSRPPSQMDVNRLQEQYHYLKEKQKLHTHVVVFKTGGKGAIPRKSMISAVLIKKSMRKALKGREFKVGLPCHGNGQDSSPWRIHIHHLAHHQERPYDSLQNRTGCGTWSCEEESLDGTEPAIAFSIKEENSHPSEEMVSSNSTRTSVTSIWTYSSLNISASKPVSSKLSYYPFPQKKNPKVSEAAKKLGLYVSQ
ncbi:uncharacterized protein C9orf152 homolog isoform X1 [Crotalus tigris]|uniref:uncharacterized protein C9orf152 homolog isoform X1 n=1 Tax=Crotalus tigris TaxID=88082 RepID=UPI00192F2B6A|nr:uncharacterized protein C9orf152 homolog isoform X1 [Crotalus tigris]